MLLPARGGISPSLSATSSHHESNRATIPDSCKCIVLLESGENTQVILSSKTVSRYVALSAMSSRCFMSARDIPSRKNQPEGVIEHEVAARAVRKQLEDLGIIHRPLLLVDL